jgi:hypothetical protein
MYRHPTFPRRAMLQAGSIGLLGLGMNHLAGLREASAASGIAQPAGKAKACIYIFLSGGLAQHDSFDPKPDAPDTVRGEFRRESKSASTCRCSPSGATTGPWSARSRIRRTNTPPRI